MNDRPPNYFRERMNAWSLEDKRTEAEERQIKDCPFPDEARGLKTQIAAIDAEILEKYPNRWADKGFKWDEKKFLRNTIEEVFDLLVSPELRQRIEGSPDSTVALSSLKGVLDVCLTAGRDRYEIDKAIEKFDEAAPKSSDDDYVIERPGYTPPNRSRGLER